MFFFIFGEFTNHNFSWKMIKMYFLKTVHFQPFKIKSNFETNIAILREFHRDKGKQWRREKKQEGEKGKKERERERERERG